MASTSSASRLKSLQQKFKVSFGKQPPKTVRWGSCSYDGIPLLIGVTETGAVCHVLFAKEAPQKIMAEWQKSWPKTVFKRDEKAIAPAVKKIVAGKEMDLHLIGTEFQCAVWRNLLAIPHGEVITYAELARRSKRPKAVRAAGSACGANPIAILVPCHRVLASNGGLGGFGGGLPTKKKLLLAEGQQQL